MVNQVQGFSGNNTATQHGKAIERKMKVAILI